MKTAILCGGLGSRLGEEAKLKPKPMVEIGGRPILLHIMSIYGRYDFNDFILALGYKSEVIKDYFLHYHARQSDLKIDLKSGQVEYNNPTVEDWSVSLIDTGSSTMTGGRLLRLKRILESEATFMLTYGDGVANVDVAALVDFHSSHGRLATVTAVRPPALRFGELEIDAGRVARFEEKPQAGHGWVSGGFFVFEAGIFDYIRDDSTLLEREPLEQLARDGELMPYHHYGYWQCMDTLRDKRALEEECISGHVPWLE